MHGPQGSIGCSLVHKDKFVRCGTPESWVPACPANPHTSPRPLKGALLHPYICPASAQVPDLDTLIERAKSLKRTETTGATLNPVAAPTICPRFIPRQRLLVFMPRISRPYPRSQRSLCHLTSITKVHQAAGLTPSSA